MAEASERRFTESLQIKEIGENEYETIHPPERMGNAAKIAYGGFTSAMAVKSAGLTVPQNYHLYSIMGNFLGPALIDRPLQAKVRIIRQTRTFATRQVEVSQKQDDGSSRACMVALADFQVAEAGSLLQYSAEPLRKYSHYSEIKNTPDQIQDLVDNGTVTQKEREIFMVSFGLMRRLFETRLCPEGIFAQNLYGVAKNAPTTQDDFSITEKTTADWMHIQGTLPDKVDQLAALTFFMDGALSFSPLSFSNRFLDAAAACSSLDFALRIFSNNVDLEKWHLREIKTVVGAEGRTYSEGILWDEHGNAVASATQQSIMRPWGNEKGKGKGKL